MNSIVFGRNSSFSHPSPARLRTKPRSGLRRAAAVRGPRCAGSQDLRPDWPASYAAAAPRSSQGPQSPSRSIGSIFGDFVEQRHAKTPDFEKLLVTKGSLGYPSCLCFSNVLGVVKCSWSRFHFYSLVLMLGGPPAGIRLHHAPTSLNTALTGTNLVGCK